MSSGTFSMFGDELFDGLLGELGLAFEGRVEVVT